VVITEVAEVGLQRGFSKDEPAKNSVGVTFQLDDTKKISRVMPLSMNGYSNFMKLLSACDDIDELEDLLGQQLDLEVEGGQYPKTVGFYHVDDNLSGQDKITNVDGGLYYSVDDPNPDTLKQLHRILRQAISSRVREKE